MKTTITYDKGEWSFESDVLENGLQIEGIAVESRGGFDVRTTLSGKIDVPGRKKPITVYEVYNYTSATAKDFFTDARKEISKQGNRAQRMSKILHSTKKLMVLDTEKPDAENNTTT